MVSRYECFVVVVVVILNSQAVGIYTYYRRVTVITTTNIDPVIVPVSPSPLPPLSLSFVLCEKTLLLPTRRTLRYQQQQRKREGRKRERERKKGAAAAGRGSVRNTK